MRIGISLLNLRLGVMGGFETYVQKLVDYFPECVGADDEIVFIVNKDNLRFVPSGATVYEVDWTQCQTSRRRILEAVFPFWPNPLGREIDWLGFDVIFYPHQAMFPISVAVPSVVTVADIQHLYYPRYFHIMDRVFRGLVYKRAVYSCDRIMAISEFTASCIVEKYGVAKDKISVIHHGFEPLVLGQVDSLDGLPDPYIYYPAASFPHKGHLTLFRSYAALKRAGRISHKLLLSGVRDAGWDRLRKWIESEGMDQDIVDYGYVSYDDVLRLYAGADAVVFPTEFEGFGLPVLEAAQFRKKIICSRLSVFDEIGVPSSCQIDFGDPEQLFAALISSDVLFLESEPITWRESVRQIYHLLKTTAAAKQDAQ